VVKLARASGRRQALRRGDRGKWYCKEPLAAAHAALVVETRGDDGRRRRPRVLRGGERAGADARAEVRRAGAVLSTASAFRYEPDVPVFLPGVNLGTRGSSRCSSAGAVKGFIAPGPNCTTVASR